MSAQLSGLRTEDARLFVLKLIMSSGMLVWSLSSLRDLETAWHKRLPNTKWIVLLRSRFHLLHICRTVASKRILRNVGVVQVKIRVVSTNALSIVADPIDEVRASALEERILLSSLPRDVGLVYCFICQRIVNF
jgi:hypothetical protein